MSNGPDAVKPFEDVKFDAAVTILDINTNIANRNLYAVCIVTPLPLLPSHVGNGVI